MHVHIEFIHTILLNDMHVHDILIAIMHNRLAPQCSTFVVERFFLLLAAAVALVASFTKIYYVGRQYQELIRGKSV